MLAGELRCSALVEAYLQRIDAFDRAGPELNTIVTLSDQALRRAAELDAELAATGRLSGPLHGIPVLVKDCIETADTPTTFGSMRDSPLSGAGGRRGGPAAARSGGRGAGEDDAV